MRIVCSKCGTVLGSKAPHHDLRDTHGLCIPCATELYGAEIVERVISAMQPKKVIDADLLALRVAGDKAISEMGQKPKPKTAVPESRVWEETK